MLYHLPVSTSCTKVLYRFAISKLANFESPSANFISIKLSPVSKLIESTNLDLISEDPLELELKIISPLKSEVWNPNIEPQNHALYTDCGPKYQNQKQFPINFGEYH